MKKFWNWLDGKKTTISGIYWAVLIPTLPILFDGQDNIPASVLKITSIVGMILTYFGLGHKVVKATKGAK